MYTAKLNIASLNDTHTHTHITDKYPHYNIIITMLQICKYILLLSPVCMAEVANTIESKNMTLDNDNFMTMRHKR